MIVKLVSHEKYRDEIKFEFDDIDTAYSFIDPAIQHAVGRLEIIISNKDEEEEDA